MTVHDKNETPRVIPGEVEEMDSLTLVYLGRDREGAYLWRDDTGRTRVFKKLPARLPGGVYTIEGKIDAEGAMTVRGNTIYTGEMAEDAALIQTRAQQIETNLKARALERGTSRTAAIDEALAPLIELTKSWNFGDRVAVAEYVTRRVLADG